MALITTVGAADAESYITVAEADTYFAAHGSPEKWTSATESEKEGALRYAAIYLEQHWVYKSRPYNNTQALWFPVQTFYDQYGRVYGGDGVIPQVIKDMQAELALRHLIQDLFIDTTTGSADSNRIIREKSATREIEFAAPASSWEFMTNNFPLISLRLKPYVKMVSHTVPVWRGA